MSLRTVVGGILDIKSDLMLEERFELAGLESGTSFSREVESVKQTAIWKHQLYRNPAVLHTSRKAARDQSLLLATVTFLNALLKEMPERKCAKHPHWKTS